jgi:probable phosphoglycerate mutase
MTDASPGLAGRRRLYLMRHGHVDYFREGVTDFRAVPLTPEGEAQARAAGEALSGLAFDGAFSSGLPRTEHTLRLVGEANEAGLPAPVALPAFEELHGGRVIVPTREELAARIAFSFDAAAEEGATFLPGGEAFADAYERVVAGLGALIEGHAWKRALLVAHDGVNRLILGHACGAGLKGCAHFEQDLACINVLDFDVTVEEGRARIERVVIKAVNLTAYDQPKAGLTRTSLEHLFDIDFGGARPARGR